MGDKKVSAIFLHSCKVAGSYGEGVVGAIAESGISGEGGRGGGLWIAQGNRRRRHLHRGCAPLISDGQLQGHSDSVRFIHNISKCYRLTQLWGEGKIVKLL